MYILKKNLNVLFFLTLLTSINAYAGVIVEKNLAIGGRTAFINDKVSSGDRAAFLSNDYNNNAFDINQMNVKWSADNTITVDIFTRFADFRYENGTETNNQRYDSHGKSIVYGDLLIGVDTLTDYNYGYYINSDRYVNTALDKSTEGGLYAAAGTLNSSSRHVGDRLDDNPDGAYRIRPTGNELGNNTSWSVAPGKISFSFNVDGIDAFTNARTLDLAWSMSCFNDDVHGSFTLLRDDVVDVPEPATLMLLLLVLPGMVYRKKIK